MDGIFSSKLHYQDHEDVLYHEVSQPTESLILERNADLRKNPDSLQDLGANSAGGSWGRQIASIPFIIYDEAIRNGFALNHKDADVAGKEMHRFLQTEKGRLCLVRG